MTIETEEGWYSDPFGLHEARWLSDGHPTKLVRDHGVESYDRVPDGPATQTPTRIQKIPLRQTEPTCFGPTLTEQRGPTTRQRRAYRRSMPSLKTALPTSRGCMTTRRTNAALREERCFGTPGTVGTFGRFCLSARDGQYSDHVNWQAEHRPCH